MFDVKKYFTGFTILLGEEELELTDVFAGVVLMTTS